MDKDVVKNLLDQAIDIVDGYKEPYKSLAFEKIVEVGLRNVLSGQKNMTEPTTDVLVSSLPTSVDAAVRNFGSKLNIPVSQLGIVYEFEGEKPNVIVLGKKLKGKKADQQRTLALLYLVAMEEVYKVRQVAADEIRQLCKDFGVYEVNFASNLKGFENYIISTVRKGSSGGEYRLTVPGRMAAYEVVKQFSKD